MKRFITLLFFVALTGPADSAHSAIQGEDPEVIDFCDDSSKSRASWERGTLSENGLVLEKGHSSIETEPIGCGLSWRPPSVMDIDLAIKGSNIISPPDVFVRYSTDKVHWSTWQYIPPPDDVLGEAISFKTILRVTEKEIRAFYDHPDYRDSAEKAVCPMDEDEIIRILYRDHPEIFSRIIPIIGWIQFRMEFVESASATVEAIEFTGGWGVSGLVVEGEDCPPERKGGKWSFDAAHGLKVETPEKEKAP